VRAATGREECWGSPAPLHHSTTPLLPCPMGSVAAPAARGWLRQGRRTRDRPWQGAQPFAHLADDPGRFQATQGGERHVDLHLAAVRNAHVSFPSRHSAQDAPTASVHGADANTVETRGTRGGAAWGAP